jgi:sialate O-acetylesterase
MACITDIGVAKDIHPKNKQGVGKRLARWALHHNYGMADIVPSGPLVAGYRTVGDKVHVRFHNAAGLKTRDKNPVSGFEIAGEDRVFVAAKAEIKGDTVIVSADGIASPNSVRYAWAANPVGANLVNGAGLPTSVFRTDQWAETTFDSGEPDIRN